ncbi:hypothetical protein [Lignipirellula cremea]|uniref:Autotransporter-associated beta strand repeat protein n=1 Tax=Lignipirellula cremea TaxID=2528010 RepID=A0A518DYA2_9BACT|nr:hypothetical protein [Lignipirellula cremea]QDU96826.1 hypothetical protein Pla8534_46480 [Lignipirellula cremea]
MLGLSGDNTYTGLTTVEAGFLVNSGSLAGDVTVFDGATYGGSGSAQNLIINSGGVLAVGDGIGTTTAASLTLNSGSIMEF